tara:strand:- start:312 stop:3470 length:3159 start_codon:yes stop_codon:yes gene_type:complete
MPFNIVKKASILSITLFFSFNLLSQSNSTEEQLTVIGSQIKGASISDVLPVSVFSADDIDALGVESGDDLISNIAEMGQNQFNEASETAGINNARGDIGAYNLRNLGVGSTLVLLNGRRMVNSPGYQTEILGGGFTPVSTVNSTTIPTNGIDRLEILKDGASAIYGADAVSGVVNNVTKSGNDGFVVRTRVKQFSVMDAEDSSLSINYGNSFANGNFNISYDFVKKGQMRAGDHPIMSQSDLSPFLPGGTSDPYASFFDNTSSQGLYGQFDMVEKSSRIPGGTRGYVDSSGEFQVLPITDARCAASEGSVTTVYDTGYGTCIVSDSTTNSTPPYNKNEGVWVRGQTERHNLFITFDRDLDNGFNLYNEIGYYESEYFTIRSAASQYPGKLRVGAASYYNPIRATIGTATTNGFAAAFDPDAELYIDNYRFTEKNRTATVNKETYRLLQGISGDLNDWSFDGAVVISQAKSRDLSGNRVDLNLMQGALFDQSSAGYNILCDWVNNDCSTNIEQTLVSVVKEQISKLNLYDLKFTNDELFSMKNGPVSFLVGIESRKESYKDDLGPRMDGTIPFQHLPVTNQCQLGNDDGSMKDKAAMGTNCNREEDRYPFFTAIAGGSPTADSEASRTTNSIFTEMILPLAQDLEAQVALRYEDTNDFGSEIVGKLAFGWDITDQILLRTSASTTFKAPNLVAMNQPFLNRFNNSQKDFSKAITDDDDGYVDEWIYRRAVGNDQLEAETSENFSFGIVYQPTDELTLTLDGFQIKKDNTVGNLGTTNQTALDFLTRYRAKTGTADADATAALSRCSSLTASQYNTNVYRNAADDDDYDDMSAAAKAAGLCPLGEIRYVRSQYENLAERIVEGVDLGIYYEKDSDYGTFSIKYTGAFTTKLEQNAAPGSDADIIDKAIKSGEYTTATSALGADDIVTVNLFGYGDLLGIDGNFEEKHQARFSWRYNDNSASMTVKHVGAFRQSSVTNTAGIAAYGGAWEVDEMTTINLALATRFKFNDTRMKLTIGSNNLFDAETPLADDTYGFNPDVHNGYGRSVYLDLRAAF